MPNFACHFCHRFLSDVQIQHIGGDIVTINERIGHNLRELRHMQGISGEQLSDMLLSETGQHISPDTIRRYERGERVISAADVIYFAQALSCSTQALVEGADPRIGEVPQGKHIMKPLLPSDHNILRSLATDWDGDIHALIIAGGIYAAIPQHRRREVIMELIAQIDAALRAGEISVEDLPEGLSYMQEKLGSLYQ